MPAPMMPFRVSIIDEVMASSLLRLHPAILFIGASLRNITERCFRNANICCESARSAHG